MLRNQDIRADAKNKGVYLWEVAARLSISEPTMTRKLRCELSPGEKQHIIALIDEIARTKKKAV